MPLRPKLPWRRAIRVHSLSLFLSPWQEKGLTALRRRSRARVGMGRRRAGQGTLRSLWKCSTCVCAALLALDIAGAGEPWRYSVEERRSGYTYLSEDNQRLQDDDFANPGLLWVERGRELWQQRDNTASTSCAGCHGDATASMRGVRTRYPRFDPPQGKLIN